MPKFEKVQRFIQNLPQEQRFLAAQSYLQDHFKNSLFNTAKHLCGYEDVCYPTHKSIIEALEAETKRKLIIMPRGSLKSSIASVAFPIQALIRNPNLRILLDSEIYTNSKNFLREIRGHLENERLTNIFGQFKSDCWSEGEVIIKQRTKKLKEASITAGGVDTVKVGQHYDMIIFDDLNSDNNSRTKEGRKKVIDHYQMSIAILEPNGVIVVVGTRYADDDILGTILRTEIYPPTDESKEKGLTLV